MAKGYAQKYGIDYDEIFSPVVRFSSMRFLIAFAVQHDMLIHQMDVETAFVNGKLGEEIYMQQPEGYVKPGEKYLVCKLEKSLYGLKQSSPCSNKAFRERVEKIGFTQATTDPCVFIRKEDTLTIIAIAARLYTVNGTTVEMVAKEKDLGITITKDRTWNNHLKAIVSKANRKMGFIKRNCFALLNTKTLILLYTS